MTPRAQGRLLSEVQKRVLQRCTQTSDTCKHLSWRVYDTKTLHRNWIYGGIPQKKPLLSQLMKKNCCIFKVCKKEHLDVLKHHRQNILKLDETKADLEETQKLCEVKKRRAHQTSKTHPHPGEVWWRGHRGLGLLSCFRAWTDWSHWLWNEFPSLSRQCAEELEAICLTKWSSTEDGWYNRTTI